MSLHIIEKKTLDILMELQKIKSKSPRKPEDFKELDRIKNSIVRKILNKEIDPSKLTVEFIMYGCQILESEAEEIYVYLKTVELI